MSNFRYAFRAFTRAGLRSAAYLVGLALAVALFSGTLFFIDGSTRSMTQRAAAPVKLDFQARSLDAKTDVTAFANLIRQQKGVKAVSPFVSAAVNVITTTTSTATGVTTPATGGSNNTTPASSLLPARLFAFPPAYLEQFPLLQLTNGQFGAGGALINEQMAVSLKLKAGDTLQLTVPGMNQPYPVKITGTVNTDYADPLFSGPTAAPEGSYNFAAAVVIVDFASYSRDLAAPLLAAMTSTQTNQNAPNQSPTNPASQSGLPLLDRQLHINIDRNTLPSDPGEAQTQIGVERRLLERQVSGQLKITDNLTGTLRNAAGDVVSARLLFIFLGLPGILLAAYLSRYAAGLVIASQRQEIALLRSRGLNPARLQAIMGWTAALVALLGTTLGLGLGAASTAAIFGTSVFSNVGGLLLSTLLSLGLGLVLGGFGIYLPTRQMLQAEISDERRSIGATTRPIWLRLPLDLILLAIAGLAFWFSSTYNTKTATAGASETAAVSLGIYSFIGPLLFWLGAALLFRRILEWGLSRPAGARWRGGIYGLASRTLKRRKERSAGVALLLALAFSFGVATTTFGATYEASHRAEARYIVGSDLRITPALTNPLPASFGSKLMEASPDLKAVTPVGVVNNVLVGSQTQTVYGIDLSSFQSAASVPDKFFVDGSGSAGAELAKLAATPDGLLVSNELAKSYNIVAGDIVNMRIPAVDGTFTEAKLQVTGIFTMFPTSSQNSDLVVNQAYLAKATHDPNSGFFLARTDGSPGANANAASQITGKFKAQQLALRVEQADLVINKDQSSLSGLNLSGLVSLDRFFSALIVGLGLGVFLLGSVLERQRELGTLQAVGATRRQVTALLLLEGCLLVIGGVIGGVLIGLILAWQYNSFLPGIFSVSLPVISVPYLELAGLIGLGLGGMALAAGVVMARLRRLWPAEVLRESTTG